MLIILECMEDNVRNKHHQLVVPAILINGITFLLMLFLDDSVDTGLFTFKNLFSLTILITFATFGILMTIESVKMCLGFIKKRKPLLAIGQIIITLFILFVAGSFVYVIISSVMPS